jgi:hypothetical protein
VGKSRAGELGNRWIILRTAGRCTLPLAASLAKAGYQVWTPAKTETVRVPRANARRDVTMPIMPTFIFAKATSLVDLIELSETPDKGHEEFSVFHYFGRIPLLADIELEALRSEETRAVPKRKRKVYAKGERVRVPEGSFAGMSGIVQQADGQYALVSFGGSLARENQGFSFASR